MDAVVAHESGHAVDVLQKERHERDVVFCGQPGVDGVELRGVVRAEVGRQHDAGEQHADVVVLEGLDHSGEILIDAVDGLAAQAVIAAKLEDDEGRMGSEGRRHAREGILGGVAVNALVDELDVVAGCGKGFAEEIGVGIADGRAIAGGEAVAEAQDGLGVGEARKQKQEDRGESQGEAQDHLPSVPGAIGGARLIGRKEFALGDGLHGAGVRH